MGQDISRNLYQHVGQWAPDQTASSLDKRFKTVKQMVSFIRELKYASNGQLRNFVMSNMCPCRVFVTCFVGEQKLHI